MERRSWMWHSKSFEKSSAQTDETSESLYDDNQEYATQTAPFPEVMSKAASNEEVVTDVDTLTEKLSAALLDISAKEELVKQNAKVAEEAVSGWEKAENEVLTLKQELDVAKQKNAVLEDQISHLNEELKNCMRQLRQAREEKEQNIHEPVANTSCNWESERPDFEWKVAELEAQLQTAKEDAATSVNSGLLQRLEDVERENSSLKIELQSRLEELEFKTFERDLSTEAAETASKQHLESINKVAKLEAECRRLNAMARKTFSANDRRSLTYSSVCAESFTDSMSDSGEKLLVVENDMHKFGGWETNEGEPKHYDSWPSASITESDQFKNENTTAQNRIGLSSQTDLMDDFLEMERLAALPDTESVSSFFVVNTGTDTMNAEVEALVQKNAALENKLAKMEADKFELEMDLNECQKQLEASQSRLKEVELEVIELQNQLSLANKSNEEAYEELKAAQIKNEKAESKLRAAQTEAEELISKICSLEEEIEKERALSAENLAECEKLEDELLRMKQETQLQQDTKILHREGVDTELMFKQEKELALAASRFSECRKTIESLGQQLKSLATLEDFLLDSENNVELSSDLTPHDPQDGGEQFKLHNSDLSSLERDSESPTSLNLSSFGKSHFSFGRFYSTKA
ncbi:filament-like plant protein [Trifolium pratense]|uniref:filament-like plant protein n=1 Tax=Trifolium pratense TaxID=57577 RepID=UPI001E693591|nr:filament-like plant protein [Trifolium pratense]XP_045823703.1 filament-like plant protein [Trifolium pratense]